MADDRMRSPHQRGGSRQELHRTLIPVIESLNRDMAAASFPAAEHVRRKPIAMDGLWQDVHTSWSSVEGGGNSPQSVTYEHAPAEAPTALPNFGARISIPEPHPQYNSNQDIDQIDSVPGQRNSRRRLEQQFTHAGNKYGEGVEDGNIDGQYNYSSTTLDSTHPMVPRPYAAQFPPVIPQPRPRSPMQEVALIATICLSMFLTQAGLAQSIAPLPLIAGTFTTATHAPSPSWYSAAYSLTVSTFILPSGRLGDTYGPKRLYVIGWLWFTVASLSAGFDPRIVEAADQQHGSGGEVFFCFCRAMQGIGPALLMPNGLAILGRTYEGNMKNMAFALFGASAPVGFVVGSVMSSLLAQKAHWSWAYWALAIACAVMAAVSLCVIPSFPDATAPVRDDDGVCGCDSSSIASGVTAKVPVWKQLDVPGTVLGVTGLILINVALNQAPIVSWSTPYTYFILIIGLIVLSFFFFIEFTPFLTPHPLIPLEILSLDTCFVLACIACGWGTFGIWIFYLWEFLEALRGLSPLLASAQFAPAAVSGMLAAITTGVLLSKTTPQVIMVLSMLAFFVGTTLIATAPVGQIYWAQAFFSIIIMPWGMDMSFPSATILLSGKVGPENQGVAMSVVNTVVNYSISVGLGLAGTVQSNVDRDGTQPLTGFRGAWYLGMGLSGTGIWVAVAFLAICTWKMRYGFREKEKIAGEA